MYNVNKQFSLEGKVALVTGAAYGIGFAIAEALASAGAKIAFNCRGQHHMDEAIKAYDSIDKDGAIFIQIWNNGNEAQSAPIPEKFKRSKSVLKQQEVYVVAEDWSWTFVSTHENGWLGPYFYEVKSG